MTEAVARGNVCNVVYVNDGGRCSPASASSTEVAVAVSEQIQLTAKAGAADVFRLQLQYDPVERKQKVFVSAGKGEFSSANSREWK